jgi:hypothetical protein
MLPGRATSTADTVATPSAGPHCLLAGLHRESSSAQRQQREGQGDGQRAPRPQRRHEPTGRTGERERPGRLRDEAQAGEHRAERPPLLQVQRRQQHLPGAEGADRDQAEVGAQDAAVLAPRDRR